MTAEPDRTDLRRVGRLFAPYRARCGVVLALIFFSAALAMVAPFLLRAVVDEAIPHRDTALLTWLVLGMIAIAIATGALSVAQTWLSNLVGQHVMHDLRAAVYRPPPAAVPRLLYSHTHGGGAVADRQ